MSSLFSLPYSPILPPVGTILSYSPSSHELPFYQYLFSRANPTSSAAVSAQQSVQFLSLSTLPTQILKHIWSLSDNKGENSLDFSKFCIAVRLIQLVQNGVKVNRRDLMVNLNLKMRNVFFRGITGMEKVQIQRELSVNIQSDISILSSLPTKSHDTTRHHVQPNIQDIATQNTLTQHNIPSQSIQQTHSNTDNLNNTGLVHPPPTSSTTTLVTSSYFLTPTEIDQYTSLFPSVASSDGYIYGAAAIEFFTKSGVSNEVLRDLWNLVDQNPIDNRLCVVEFCIMMCLVIGVKSGKEVPRCLPEPLERWKKSQQGTQYPVNNKSQQRKFTNTHTMSISDAFGQFETQPQYPQSVPHSTQIVLCEKHVTSPSVDTRAIATPSLKPMVSSTFHRERHIKYIPTPPIIPLKNKTEPSTPLSSPKLNNSTTSETSLPPKETISDLQSIILKLKADRISLQAQLHHYRTNEKSFRKDICDVTKELDILQEECTHLQKKVSESYFEFCHAMKDMEIKMEIKKKLDEKRKGIQEEHKRMSTILSQVRHVSHNYNQMEDRHDHALATLDSSGLIAINPTPGLNLNPTSDPAVLMGGVSPQSSSSTNNCRGSDSTFTFFLENARADTQIAQENVTSLTAQFESCVRKAESAEKDAQTKQQLASSNKKKGLLGGTGAKYKEMKKDADLAFQEAVENRSIARNCQLELTEAQTKLKHCQDEEERRRLQVLQESNDHNMTANAPPVSFGFYNTPTTSNTTITFPSRPPDIPPPSINYNGDYNDTPTTDNTNNTIFYGILPPPLGYGRYTTKECSDYDSLSIAPTHSSMTDYDSAAPTRCSMTEALIPTGNIPIFHQEQALLGGSSIGSVTSSPPTEDVASPPTLGGHTKRINLKDFIIQPSQQQQSSHVRSNSYHSTGFTDILGSESICIKNRERSQSVPTTLDTNSDSSCKSITNFIVNTATATSNSVDKFIGIPSPMRGVERDISKNNMDMKLNSLIINHPKDIESINNSSSITEVVPSSVTCNNNTLHDFPIPPSTEIGVKSIQKDKAKQFTIVGCTDCLNNTTIDIPSPSLLVKQDDSGSHKYEGKKQ